MQTGSTGVKNNVVMAVLAYLGLLVLIPLLVSKDDSFVKFHIKQGLVLLVIEAASWILPSIFFPLFFIFMIIRLVVFILAIIGIIHAVKGEQKELPIVGSFSSYFPI